MCIIGCGHVHYWLYMYYRLYVYIIGGGHLMKSRVVDHFQQKEEDSQPSSISQWLPPQVRISVTLLCIVHTVHLWSLYISFATGESFPWEVRIAIFKASQLPQEWCYPARLKGNGRSLQNLVWMFSHCCGCFHMQTPIAHNITAFPLR